MGLLRLSDLLEQPGLVGACERIARKLLRAADKSASGDPRSASATPSSRNLTGFSHGTAGIGCALLELFHATGDLESRKAAEAAFHYDDRWYDPEMQDWPDLREGPAAQDQICVHFHLALPGATEPLGSRSPVFERTRFSTMPKTGPRQSSDLPPLGGLSIPN